MSIFKKRLLSTGLVTLSLFSQHLAWANTSSAEGSASKGRPPQYVLLAFDGSYTLDVWQQSRDFTKRQKSYGIDNRFTFFLNPVYLVSEANKSVYKAPGRFRGSAIGWGDDKRDVELRIDQMNEAYLEGHEIGSHAVGHHDGSGWGEAEWDSEFRQYNYMVDNALKINGTRVTPGGSDRILFAKDMIGFRAPLLGFSKGMWPVLKKYGFQYDTSRSAPEAYWPKVENGVWNFALADIKDNKTAKLWKSMDYNFCYRDSLALLTADPSTFSHTHFDKSRNKTITNRDKFCLNSISLEQKKQVKDQMMRIYKSYFNNNYYGNRAPIHIGHHFSQWMRGAYYEAFYDFANEVCGKAEVKCVTYKELMNYMKSLTPEQRANYESGNFNKLPRPKSLASNHLDVKLVAKLEGGQLKVDLIGKHAAMSGNKTFVTTNGVKSELGQGVKLESLIKAAADQDVVRVSVEDIMQNEIQSAVYEFTKDAKGVKTLSLENLEDRAMQGHMEGAHKYDKETDLDFRNGNR